VIGKADVPMTRFTPGRNGIFLRLEDRWEKQQHDGESRHARLTEAPPPPFQQHSFVEGKG